MYKLFLRDHAKIKVKLTKYHKKINLIKMANYSKLIHNLKGTRNLLKTYG